MTTLKNSDLFLVNRGGVDYKITAQELKEFLTAVPSPPGTSMPWEGHDGGIWHVNNLGQVPVLLGPEGSSFDSWTVDGSDQRSISQLEIGEERVIVSPPNQEYMFGNEDKNRRNSDAEFEFGSYTDTSRVTNLYGCFAYCTKFNGSLGGNWDTSNVTDMAHMFNDAVAFNQDISGWNTSKVTSMYYMFFNLKYFDQDLSGWDTSNVTNMGTLFRYCDVFNADISQWDVSNVTEMGSMFSGAYQFNQDLSNWCVAKMSEPYYFDDNATAWTEPRPCWGHCPRGENGTVDPCPPPEMPWDAWEGPVLHIQELEDPGVTTHYSYVAGCELPVKVYDLDGNFLEETWQLETAKFGNEFVILVDNYDPYDSYWSLECLFVKGRSPSGKTPFDCKFGPLTDVSMVTNFMKMFSECREFTGKGSLGTWNTKSAEDMGEMFDRCDVFVEDISQWCVPLIAPGSGESNLRATNLPAEHEPCWGHCPRGENGTVDPCPSLPLLPWEGHDGGIWHIKNVQNAPLKLDLGRTFFTAWDIDGAGERKIREVAVGEELVFTSGARCPEMFKGNNTTTWEFGEFTDTSKVTNMVRLFDYANVFNSDISTWDTSNVTDMGKMFYGAHAFNTDINTKQVTVNGNTYTAWDVSKVADMNYMFYDAHAFNQKIGNWDTSLVRNMQYMFYYCSAFNQDIGDWNTSGVNKMEYMFYYTFVFNQDISRWDTSLVGNMEAMFMCSYDFNQDISGWDTSNVSDMKSMFNCAYDFDQDISSWDVKYITPKPRNFDRNAAFAGQTAKQPQWGT